jgi:hypothetical protein
LNGKKVSKRFPVTIFSLEKKSIESTILWKYDMKKKLEIAGILC